MAYHNWLSQIHQQQDLSTAEVREIYYQQKNSARYPRGVRPRFADIFSQAVEDDFLLADERDVKVTTNALYLSCTTIKG